MVEEAFGGDVRLEGGDRAHEGGLAGAVRAEETVQPDDQSVDGESPNDASMFWLPAR